MGRTAVLPRKPDGMRLVVNGKPVEVKYDKGYATVQRTWKAGDVVEQHFTMPVRRVLSHPNVDYNRGRVAIERGPIVYCVEGADHDGKAMNLYLPDAVALTPEHRSDMLGGITVLTGEGAAAYKADDGTRASRPAKLTLIPYYAWCHRGANEMAVWLPRSIERAEVPPKPTTATTARASASHCWQADHIGAVNDGIEPKSSIDHDIPRFTWWDHRGTSEWAQLDLAKPTKMSSTAVFWFDDTGRGGCRVPKSWQLLYRDNGV